MRIVGIIFVILLRSIRKSSFDTKSSNFGEILVCYMQTVMLLALLPGIYMPALEHIVQIKDGYDSLRRLGEHITC